MLWVSESSVVAASGVERVRWMERVMGCGFWGRDQASVVRVRGRVRARRIIVVRVVGGLVAVLAADGTSSLDCISRAW